MQIVYLTDDQYIRELFSLEIEARFNCVVHELQDGKDLRSLFSSNKIDLVIYDIESANTNDLKDTLKESGTSIKLIAIGSIDVDDDKELRQRVLAKEITYLRRPVDPTLLLNTISDILNIPYDDGDSYSRVKLFRFMRFTSVSVDVYLKLGNDNYIKILNRDEFYTQEFMEKYLDKDVKYVHIKKTDFSKFSIDYTKILQLNLKTKIGGPVQKVVDVHLAALSFVHEIAHNIGISEDVVTLVDGVVDSSLKMIKGDENLYTLLKSVIKEKNFIYEHSLLTAYITSAMVIKASWYSDVAMKKLVVASILHDIGLSDLDKCARYDLDDIDGATFKELSYYEKKIVRDHPIFALKILEKAKKLPPDVDKIVAFHHELPQGKGYPSKVDASQLGIIICLFIVGERMARSIYNRKNDNFYIKHLVEELESELNVGNFKGPIALLKKCF